MKMSGREVLVVVALTGIAIGHHIGSSTCHARLIQTSSEESDLQQLAFDLVELGEAFDQSFGGRPEGDSLVVETLDLASEVLRLRREVAGLDRQALARAYAPLSQSWERIASRFERDDSRLGATRISRALRTVARRDEALRRQLGLSERSSSLRVLLRRYANDVVALREGLRTEMGETTARAILIEDTRNLEAALNTFDTVARRGAEQLDLASGYDPVGWTWFRIEARMTLPGLLPPELRPIVERIHQWDAAVAGQVGRPIRPSLLDESATIDRVTTRMAQLGRGWSDQLSALREALGELNVASRDPLAQQLESIRDQVRIWLARIGPGSNRSGLARETRDLLERWERFGEAAERRGWLNDPRRRFTRQMVAIDQTVQQLTAIVSDLQTDAPPRPPRFDAASVQRLASSLNRTAEALANVSRSDLVGNPDGVAIILDTQLIAVQCDFFERIFRGAPTRDQVRQAYQDVATRLDRLGRKLGEIAPRRRLPRSVLQAWEALRTIDNALRDQLQISQSAQTVQQTSLVEPNPQPNSTPPTQTVPNPTPLRQGDRLRVQLTQLVRSLDIFLAGFRPSAGQVPQGTQFLEEVEAIRRDAVSLSEALGRGTPASEVTSVWRRVVQVNASLQRRTDRLAQGREGPNIQRVRAIGRVVDAIETNWPR